MIRALIKSLTILLFIVIIALGAVWFLRVPIANYCLTESLGVECQVQKINFSRNSIIVEGVKVENGSQTQTPIMHALRVDKIELTGEIFTSSSRDTTQYNKLLVQSPYFGIEIYNEDGTENNWSTLIVGLKKEAKETENQETSEDDHEYVIEHVQIKNIEVEAYNPQVSAQLIRPDPIEELNLYNLHTDNHKALNVLISIISQAIINEIIQNHPIGKLLKNVEEIISNPIKNGVQKPTKKAGKMLKQLLPSFDN